MERDKNMPEQQLTVTDWMDWLGIHQLEDREEVGVLRFIFLWMKYNNWYAQKYNLRDSQGAVRLSQDILASQIYEKYFKESFLEAFQRIETASSNPREGLYKGNGRREEIIAPFTVGSACLCKFLQLIYKIRCNFFHGEKVPSTIDVKLICWASESLCKLLEKLEEENIVNLNEVE